MTISKTTPVKKAISPGRRATNWVKDHYGIDMKQQAVAVGTTLGVLNTWRSGKTIPSEQWIDKFEEVYPGFRAVYEEGAIEEANALDELKHEISEMKAYFKQIIEEISSDRGGAQKTAIEAQKALIEFLKSQSKP